MLESGSEALKKTLGNSFENRTNFSFDIGRLTPYDGCCSMGKLRFPSCRSCHDYGPCASTGLSLDSDKAAQKGFRCANLLLGKDSLGEDSLDQLLDAMVTRLETVLKKDSHR